jgi:phosphoribosyl 1,2-cyclic phosphodiesterase
VEVRAAGEIIILDAGTGLRPLGVELAAEFAHEPLRATLLLSHTHWDHIQGLPFFSPVYKPQNRLRILGYEGARNGLRNVLSNQMDTPYFPVGLREVPANLEIEELGAMEFSVGAVRVQACYANHPGICMGYRLFTPAGSVAFFPDNESGHRANGAPGAGDTAAQERARIENRKLADFLRGTDVLIMDSQYDASEYADHVGWGHGCLDDVVALALAAEVKHLFLFHHDPSHNDAKVEEMTAHARRIVRDHQACLEVDAAREGLAVQLGGGPLSHCPGGQVG